MVWLGPLSFPIILPSQLSVQVGTCLSLGNQEIIAIYSNLICKFKALILELSRFWLHPTPGDSAPIAPRSHTPPQGCSV